MSDEFTVPLCATHHHNIHTTGKEREWWQERKIDPLIIASCLWQQSRERYSAAREVDRADDPENGADKRIEAAQPSEPDAKLGASSDATGPTCSVNR